MTKLLLIKRQIENVRACNVSFSVFNEDQVANKKFIRFSSFSHSCFTIFMKEQFRLPHRFRDKTKMMNLINSCLIIQYKITTCKLLVFGCNKRFPRIFCCCYFFCINLFLKTINSNSESS